MPATRKQLPQELMKRKIFRFLKNVNLQLNLCPRVNVMSIVYRLPDHSVPAGEKEGATVGTFDKNKVPASFDENFISRRTGFVVDVLKYSIFIL